MRDFRNIREECFEANLSLPKTGLVDLTFGNVSVADPERGVFAIKPSGVSYEDLQPEHMVVVRLDDGSVVQGQLRYSSDTPTHRRLFQAFPGIRSVVHTHSRNAVAFAQAGRPIPCLGTTHCDYFHGDIPVTRPLSAPEIGEGYEWETGNVIVERFTQASPALDPDEICAVLVCNHGPFAWGPDGKKAVETAFALEIVAEMAMKTLQLNREVNSVSRPLLDKHFFRKHGAGAYYGQT